MKEILFATGNKNKVKEVNLLLDGLYKVITPFDLGITDDVEETGETFKENALLKTQALQKQTKLSIFSEDTGLLLPALGLRPGVKTARYAGENATAQDNMSKLQKELNGKKDRSAYFRTVICLFWNAEYYYFEGECHGTISAEQKGGNGFGYDPLFIPNGYDKTFGELGVDIKKKLSHRALAISKLVEFLKKEEA